MGSKLLKRGGQRRDRREIIRGSCIIIMQRIRQVDSRHGGGSLTDGHLFIGRSFASRFFADIIKWQTAVC